MHLNKRGTYGIASAAYWWGRLAAMVHRALLYTTSSACPVWALLFADDWDICAQAPDLAKHWLLSLWVLELFQVPIQWRKCKGGHTYTWVGYEKCLQEFHLGISARRAAWIEQWMSRTLEQGRITRKEMQEAVGRLVFVYGALSWDRPFLAPLFAFIHTGDLHVSTPLPLFVKSILFWLRARLRQRRSFPCHIDHQWRGSLMRVDAKAEGMTIGVGGWQPTADADGVIQKSLSPWFCVKLDATSAPWAFHKCLPYKTISSLELLASTIGSCF